MGYTHYFVQNDDFTTEQWKEIKRDTKKILANCKIPLQYEYNNSRKPLINDSRIRFNGVGEEGHETFLVNKNLVESFNFCKTAHKPYDLPVCLCLLRIVVIAPGVLNVSSDGEWDNDEWTTARNEYLKLFGEQAVCVKSLMG